MNLPGLGRHCSESGCGQLDFLPFDCPECHGVFCLAHHKLGDHSPCASFDRARLNTMPVCPVCQATVYARVDASRDAVVNAHIASGCTLHLLETKRAMAKENLSLATRCEQPTGCRNAEKLSTLVCQQCSRQFCLSHRLPDTHRCTGPAKNSKRPIAASSSSASSTSSVASADKHAKGNALLAKLREKRAAKEAEQTSRDAAHAAAYPVNVAAVEAKSKNKPTGFLTLQQLRAGINSRAAAAASAISSLMPSSSPPAPSAPAASSSSLSPSPPAAASPSPSSPASYPTLKLTAALKARAIGDADIPDSSRLYLQVDVTALKPKRPVSLCFFSTRHSIGKVLDLICDATGIENENHLPQGRRIFVVAPRTGATFPTELQLHLLEGALLQGDTIKLTRQPL